MATTLRSNLIRLASSYPQGSDERKKLLTVLAGFPADSIGETVSGPTGIPGSDAQKPWASGEFTQQENMELDSKQESGAVGDGKPDDGPMKVAAEEKGLYTALVHLARDNKEARGPILAMFREAGLLPKAAKKGEETDQKACGDDMVAGKQAGCEKLPEALRKNCEEKASGGDKDDDKDEKKKEAALRSALIRLANENPAFRGRLVPMIVAYDQERAATR